MQRLLILLVATIIVTGCSTIEKVDRLVTLKDLGTNQEQLDDMVDASDQKFKSMIEAYEKGTLSDYATKSNFQSRFGNPVLIQESQWENSPHELWIYRKMTEFFNTEKIYLYFDHGGKLAHLQYVPAPKKDKGKE